MTMELRCPKCGTVIAKGEYFEEGGFWCYFPAPEMTEDRDSGGHRLLCPREGCGGYLRAVQVPTPEGAPAKFRIIR